MRAVIAPRRALLPACVALGAAACGQAPPREVPPPVLVRHEQVRLSGEGRVRTFAGVAQAPEQPQLSFKVNGTLVELPIDVGDRVRRGQLLAQLDPTDYQLSVEDAQAALRRAQAEARNARAAFERTRELYENGNASRTEYDAARTAADSARAAVVSAGKRLELAERQLDYTRLLAPADGAIATKEVALNENVRAGQPVAMLVEAGGRIEVHVTMPESLIARVARGQRAEVRFEALGAAPVAAEVGEVGVAATGTGTTFPVTVRIAEPHPQARAGMTAEVDFHFAEDEDAGHARLPAHAVGEDRAGRYVFIVQPQPGGLGVVRRRAVTVGDLTTEGLEVLSGLSDGDHVVTAGLSLLADGQTVRLEAAEQDRP